MLALILNTMLLASPSSIEAKQPELQCNLGPTMEHIGGNDWLVYGCADGKSVVVVAGEPNPASPFVFILTPHANEVDIHGEGTGAKSATQPAYDHLADMSVDQLAGLYSKAITSSEH
ncbi:hypothetical protein GGR67_000459 [Xanthomonas arboricola]|nr:hypothetical protein [Xanthomonas euroxanthea]